MENESTKRWFGFVVKSLEVITLSTVLDPTSSLVVVLVQHVLTTSDHSLMFGGFIPIFVFKWCIHFNVFHSFFTLFVYII